ncbi:hypothetical protein Pmani_000857 [Petrolisthes manimaculis]|uniref:Uncharacterized protein n=1 Tax=Petrolisthes manimaculis TaxID=1843537 RepID=A0AAE1QLL9_9EUCA|nr:hypothetical protein Pmani_000857 [Petrolisthes manimaculis]
MHPLLLQPRHQGTRLPEQPVGRGRGWGRGNHVESTAALHAAPIHPLQHQLCLLFHLRRHLQEVFVPAPAHETKDVWLQTEQQFPEISVAGKNGDGGGLGRWWTI